MKDFEVGLELKIECSRKKSMYGWGEEKKRMTDIRKTETHRCTDGLIHDDVAKPSNGNWGIGQNMESRTCSVPEICTWTCPVDRK